LGWTGVLHGADPENRAARRLAERLGRSRLGATRRLPPFDAAPTGRWGQTREEWRARRR